MPMPFPDALQEFKVDASGIGAAGGPGDRAARSTP